jgi:hypothetical protein
MWFESEVLRYGAALLPFPVAALIWQDQAIAIAQAPLPMFAVVYMVETHLLRVPRERRAALASKAEIEAAMDAFRARARTVLTRIAAARGLAEGALWLVAEQSDLIRVAPLTFVSVQAEPATEVLALTREEEGWLHEALFAAPFSEEVFRRVNLAAGEFLRAERLEVRTLSAHARMAALLRAG